MANIFDATWRQWTNFVLFLISTLLCTANILHALSLKVPNRSGRYGTERFRWTFRSWFQGLLLLANASRMASSLAEMCMGLSFDNNLHSWLAYLLRGIPSLIFFSMYSMIVLFWSQLLFVVTHRHLHFLRPAFGIFNISAYVAFFVVAVVTVSLKDYNSFWTVDLLFNACLHAVGFVVVFAYSVDVVPRVLKTRRVAVSEHGSERRLIDQIVGLLILSHVVFFVRCVWNVILAAIFTQTETRRFDYDVFVFFFVEFVPTLLILLLTQRPRRARTPRTEIVGQSQAEQNAGSQFTGVYTEAGRRHNASESTLDHLNVFLESSSPDTTPRNSLTT